MIRLQKKFYFFKLTDHYFHTRSIWSNFWSIRKYSFLPESHPTPIGCVRTKFHTILLDMGPTEEELFNGLRSSVRQSIRKAEKLGMVADFNQDLEGFIAFYNDFTKSKGIYPIPESFKSELKQDFKVCWVRFEGEVLSAGLSLYDEKLSIAYDYLAGSRRLDDRFDRNLVGLAGKLMKKEEIMHFKRMGIKTYDFGGYAWETNDKSLQGINEYKLTFGGKVSVLYNFKTLPYYILKRISLLLDRRYQ